MFISIKHVLKNPYFHLGFIIVFHLIMWLILKPVWPFSDDYCYAYHAGNINLHGFQLTDNEFQNRIGITLPVAFIFNLFGVNPYSTSILTFMASSATIASVFIFLNKKFNLYIALFASWLIATNILQVTYSIVLFADLIVAGYSIILVILLYLRNAQRYNIYALLFVLIFLMGFLTKETIIILLPFSFILLISDLRSKKNLTYWKYLFIYAIAGCVLFFLFYWIITGNPFHRINSILKFGTTGVIDKEHGMVLKNMFENNFLKWLNGNLGLVLLFIFSIPTLASILSKDQNPIIRHFVIYSITLLAVLITMFHTTKYGPLFLMPRIWIVLIAPLSILAAFTVLELNRNKKIILLFLLVLFFVYNIPIVSINRTLFYSVFPITISIFFLLKNPKRLYYLFLLIPSIVLCINFVTGNSNYYHSYARSGNKLKSVVDSLNKLEPKIILTDEDFSINNIVYNDFKKFDNLSFVSFEKYDSVARYRNLFVLVNREAFAVPDFVTTNKKNWLLIRYQDNIAIYQKK